MAGPNPFSPRRLSVFAPDALPDGGPGGPSFDGQQGDSLAAGPHGDVIAVVGIGAGAGGEQALRALISALPTNTGMAFAVIGNPDRRLCGQTLARLLTGSTAMPVVGASNGLLLRPDHVYVASGSKGCQFPVVTIAPGIMRFGSASTVNAAPPIDVFLRSLADQLGQRAIAVILSGVGTGGTLGVGAVRATGGITLAQNVSGQFNEMPRSAVSSGCIDCVAAPDKIAGELARIARHPHWNPSPEAQLCKTSEMRGDDFASILALVTENFGRGPRQCDLPTLRQRVSRRMVLSGLEHVANYRDHLEQSPAELQALFQDVFFHATSFFRDPECFETLKETVFARLLENRDANSPLRVWVPGSATGEEAYSLVICLLEALEGIEKKPAIKVFATDMSEKAVAVARAGIFSGAIAADVSSERLRRFFNATDTGYQVNRSLRDLCVFARHDVIGTPPFSQLDLIFCRQLSAYLGPTQQRSVWPLFHFALKPIGYLLLGNSDMADPPAELFSVAEERQRTFIRGGSSAATHFPRTAKRQAETNGLHSAKSPPWEAGQSLLDEVQHVARQVADLKLKLATPEAEGGSPSGSSQRIEPSPPRGRNSRRTGSPTSANEVLQATNQLLARINLQLHKRAQVATRLNDDLVNLLDSVDIPMLVIGLDLHVRRFSPSARRVFHFLSSDAGGYIGDLKSTLLVPELVLLIRQSLDTLAPCEREVIDRMGHWYRLVIRPYKKCDGGIDGVVLTLFDIDAMKQREQELRAARDFAVNVVETVREPLAVLDTGLRIRDANHAFYQTFGLSPQEAVGQLINEVGHRLLDIPQLPQLLAEILHGGSPLEDFETPHALGSKGLRSLLINAHQVHRPDEDSPQLLLLVIEDVTQRKLDEAALQESRVHIQAINAALDGIITINRHGMIDSMNRSAEKIFGYTSAEAVGRSVSLIMPELFADQDDSARQGCAALGPAHHLDQPREAVGRRKDKSVFPMELSVAEIDQLGHFTAFVRDLSRRKELEREVLEIAASEQCRIGQELHDGIGQRLTGLRYMLRTLGSMASAQGSPESGLIEKIGDEMKAALAQVREISRGLIHFNVGAGGMVAAFEDLAVRTAELYDIDCQFTCDPQVVAPNDLTSSQLYRIAQEAILNAVKHGKARTVSMRLHSDEGAVQLDIIDDGTGITNPDYRSRGSGVHIMFYRASAIGATLQVLPASPRGTQVICRLNRYANSTQP